MPLHACYDFCWPNDLSADTEAKYPCEELWTDDHIRPNREVVRAIRDDEHIPTQPVQNGADQVVLKTEDYMFLLPGEHTEGFPGVNRRPRSGQRD